MVPVFRAFILIQAQPGRGAHVAQAVAQLEHVLEVANVTGPYDVIVLAEATGIIEIGKLVLRPIQEVEGVIRTMTCPIIER